MQSALAPWKDGDSPFDEPSEDLVYILVGYRCISPDGQQVLLTPFDRTEEVRVR